MHREDLYIFSTMQSGFFYLYTQRRKKMYGKKEIHWL